MKKRLAIISIALLLALPLGSFAATFGKLTDGAGSSNSSTDKKAVSSSTPATSGTATSITVRTLLSAAGTSTMKGIIYAASTTADQPWALLATSDEVTVTTTTESAITFPLSGANQITITSGTVYWIGFHWKDPGTPSVTLSRDNNAGGRKEATDTYSDGPSDPFSSTTALTGPIDAYVTYTETSAATSSPVQGNATLILKNSTFILKNATYIQKQ